MCYNYKYRVHTIEGSTMVDSQKVADGEEIGDLLRLVPLKDGDEKAELEKRIADCQKRFAEKYGGDTVKLDREDGEAGPQVFFRLRSTFVKR